jgi:hypothetical protein
MMIRTIVVCLLLLLPWLAGPAEAIVVACPNGFQNCDPFTGTCYTAWTAHFAGQVQAQCAADPSACWQGYLNSCGTDAIPGYWGADTWAHSLAIRHCPPMTACLNAPEPYPYTAALKASIYWFVKPLTTVAICRDEGPMFPPSSTGNWGPFLDPWICFAWRDNLTFGANHSIPAGYIQGSPQMFRSGMFGTISPGGYGENIVFYEPPSPACTWDIFPTPTAQPCEVTQAQMLAAMKDDATQWIGLSNYYRNVQARATRLNRNLASGKYGSPLSSRYAIASRRFAWLDTLLTGLAELVADPPNPNYQFLPGPSTAYPPVTLPGPDATITQTQINQHGAWFSTVRDVAHVGRQLAATIDNLAGAILDAEGGNPAANQWVYLLAVHADQVAATFAEKGALEIAARSGITHPTVAEDALCAIASDNQAMMKAAVQGGTTLYGAHLVYRDRDEHPCPVAASYPALLTDDGGVDAAAYASYLCGANPAYCPSPPSILVTYPNGGQTLPLGVPTTVTWATENQPGDVYIKLSNDAGATWTTLATVPNTGTYVWTPTSTTTGALIKVKAVGDPTVDQSDAVFSVGSIAITKPEGHVWDIGLVRKIQWTASGFAGNVKISASRDNGATFFSIALDAPNTGTYNWTVTGPATTQFLVKIKAVVNPEIKDTSSLPSVIQ